MALSNSIIRKPVTVVIIFALLALLAVYVSVQIPIDLYPDINAPFLLLLTTYEGASPEEVETGVTTLLEGALTNVSNVQSISSTSSEGSSMIFLEFGWDQDMSSAANDVRDKLEFVKDYLPDDAASPQIFILDPSMLPIITMSLSGDRPAEELNEIAINQVQPLLERVPGVSTTSVSGGREKAVRVDVTQNRLEAYNLSLTQISQLLAVQNMDTSAGSITEADRKILLETSGEFSSVEQIGETVVSYTTTTPSAGSAPAVIPVTLNDIADVYESYKDQTTEVYINGEPGIYIQLQKQSGVNSVQVADLVKERIVEINESLPPGVQLDLVYDSTKMIRTSLQSVSSSALIGAALAMVVLFVFLRNFKTTFIIGLSIPISLLITLMLMYFAGITLNLMTLAGLTLGVGMIVDSSIVILENIYRYREKGTKLLPAAELGTQEMITAISASTLTTVSVFLPVIMFKGELDIIGIIFQDMAFTIIITLLTSLVIAITLVPVLASRFLPIVTRKQKPMKDGFWKRIDSAMEKALTGLDNAYKRVLSYLLNHRGATLSVIALVFILSLTGLGFIGMELLPSAAEDSVQLNVTLAPGTPLSETTALMGKLEDALLTNIRGIETLVTNTGTTGSFFGGSSSNEAMLMVVLPEYDQRIESAQEIQDFLRSELVDEPGVEYSFESSSSISSSTPIDVEIRSDDLELAQATAEDIQRLIEDAVPAVIEPEISMGDGIPQVEIVIDRDKAYSLGLNLYNIGAEISANIDGKTATQYRSNGNEYDVVIALAEEDRSALSDLDRMFLISSTGERIALSSIATTRTSVSPASIERENRERVVHVTAKLQDGVTTDEGERQLQRAISDSIVTQDGVNISFNGEYQETIDLMKKFLWIVIIAVLLVYGVMASQFESLKDPFIIFLSMPLMLIGIVALYLITGTPISMFSAVGIVMLVGITVNNGIVLVDYTNLLRDRGMSIRQACIEAGGNRLRPVLMTSLTTILGMLPMAFAVGEGSDLVQPIGQTIVGGMTVSTFLTLIFVPLLYAGFNRNHDSRKTNDRNNRRNRRIASRAQVLLGDEAEQGRREPAPIGAGFAKGEA